VVALWPGELKGEALALYGSAERTQALLALRGFALVPRPHLGFYGASPPQRLYTTTSLTPAGYLAAWRDDLDRVHAYRREQLRGELWAWLTGRGHASDEDAAALPRFERLAGRRSIHLRPAIRVERRVDPDPRAIGAAIARVLDALGEPPLPIASGP
jgi:hypothetical protein